MPDITIITPSYNQGNFIERTIQSVHCYPSLDIEHIVVDGGSTDSTVDVLNQYSDQLHVISEPDEGQAQAINKGLRRANADIIGWLNSDDTYCPNALTSVIAFFNSHPDISIVYGDALVIDKNNATVAYYPTRKWHHQRLTESCFICQPAVFFRRKIIQMHGLLDETLHYCMDYEYWLRLAQNGEPFYYYHQDLLACTRTHEETKTVRDQLKASAETICMLHTKLGYTPFSWLLHQALIENPDKSYIHSIINAIKKSINTNGTWKSFKLIFLSGYPYQKIANKMVGLTQRQGLNRPDQKDET